MLKYCEEEDCLMTQHGFDGRVPYLEPERVEDSEIPADRDAHIQAIFNIKSTNKAGGMFKSGIHVANVGILIEVGKRQIEMENKYK